MKVLHAARRFTANAWGGTESVVASLIREQLRLGHDSRLLCTSALDEPGPDELMGVPVQRFGYTYARFPLSNTARSALDRKGGNPLAPAMFWNMLRESVAGKLNSIHVPYEAGKPVEIRTEKYNVADVMAPGEVDALVADLIRDFELNPKNDAALVSRYRTMLVEFSKDWRQLWLQFGDEEAARSRYQEAIDKVYDAMEPDRRALVTQSNDIGVNPIIVQRILRSALADYEPRSGPSASRSGASHSS